MAHNIPNRMVKGRKLQSIISSHVR